LGIGSVQSDNYAEYFNGLIDGVRISDVALELSQFLSIPEPTSPAHVAIGAVALVATLRRAAVGRRA
jgi:hypothetical protein